MGATGPLEPCSGRMGSRQGRGPPLDLLTFGCQKHSILSFACQVMSGDEGRRAIPGGRLLSVGARRCWIPRFPTNRPRLARQANQRRIAGPLVHSLAHPWLQGFCPLSSSSKNLVSLLGRLAAGAMPACHPILPSLPTLPTTFSIHPVAHF